MEVRNADWLTELLRQCAHPGGAAICGAVSYTHLDVYKRQELTRINEKKRNDSCRSSFCIADYLLVVSPHHLAGLVDVAAAEGDDQIALPGVLLDPLGGLLQTCLLYTSKSSKRVQTQKRA